MLVTPYTSMVISRGNNTTAVIRLSLAPGRPSGTGQPGMGPLVILRGL